MSDELKGVGPLHQLDRPGFVRWRLSVGPIAEGWPRSTREAGGDWVELVRQGEHLRVRKLGVVRGSAREDHTPSALVREGPGACRYRQELPSLIRGKESQRVVPLACEQERGPRAWLHRVRHRRVPVTEYRAARREGAWQCVFLSPKCVHCDLFPGVQKSAEPGEPIDLMIALAGLLSMA